MSSISIVVLLIVGMFALIALGFPIAYSIGIACVLMFELADLGSLMIAVQRMVGGLDSFVLVAIPMFTLSGYLMEKGGISRKLIAWCELAFGFLPGSTGTIAIITCMIFAALTGSGPATIIAIGSILVPSMLEKGYDDGHSSATVVAGGCLGPVIPPSSVMVVYGATMGVSATSLFIGGLIPGIMMGIGYIIVNTYYAIKHDIPSNDLSNWSLKSLIKQTWSSLGVLTLPVIVLGGIYGGFFTPTEASVVSVTYSTILGVFYHKINLRNFADACMKTVRACAPLAMILFASAALSHVLAATKIPELVATALLPFITTKTMYLILLMILLFFVGMLMETTAAIVILAPVLAPLGYALGVDPIHLGVIFCINLCLGLFTPPFGMGIFTAVSTFGTSYDHIVKRLIPYIVVAFAMIMLFALVPDIVMFLPNLIG